MHALAQQRLETAGSPGIAAGREDVRDAYGRIEASGLPRQIRADGRKPASEQQGEMAIVQVQTGLGKLPKSFGEAFPRQPTRMASMDDVRTMFDGYDGGVHHADHHIGRLLEKLHILSVDMIICHKGRHSIRVGCVGQHAIG